LIKEKKMTMSSRQTSSTTATVNTSNSPSDPPNATTFLTLQQQQQLIQSQHRRKSISSQRSLSLIYSLHKHNHRRNNQTVMKLLSSMDTLATICLKEAKYKEAEELAKKCSTTSYSSLSPDRQTKLTSSNPGTFEISFRFLFEKAMNELGSLDLKEGQLERNKLSTNKLVSLSLQSLDMVKMTSDLMSQLNGDKLAQCITLCDLVLEANVGLQTAAALCQHASVRLNQSNSNRSSRLEESSENSLTRRKKTVANLVSSDEDERQENLVNSSVNSRSKSIG
jgi:hypothetical protein